MFCLRHLFYPTQSPSMLHAKENSSRVFLPNKRISSWFFYFWFQCSNTKLLRDHSVVNTSANPVTKDKCCGRKSNLSKLPKNEAGSTTWIHNPILLNLECVHQLKTTENDRYTILEERNKTSYYLFIHMLLTNKNPLLEVHV